MWAASAAGSNTSSCGRAASRSIAGEPGAGKSVTLRLLASRLDKTEGLNVAVLSHPSSNIGDFYREMAGLFGITLIHNNL